MYRHQSLDEEIKELKILKEENKKILTTPSNDAFKRENIQMKKETPKYPRNPTPQSARLPTTPENYFSRSSTHVKPEPTTNLFNKSTLNAKPALASIYPSSISNPKIVRPGSSRTKENQKSTIQIHIPPLDRNVSSRGRRKANRKYTKRTTKVKRMENAESNSNITNTPNNPSPPPPPILQPPLPQPVLQPPLPQPLLPQPDPSPRNANNRYVLNRVRFDTHTLTRFKKMNSNIYYKFGIKLLANSDFEPRAIRYLKIAADQGHLRAIQKLCTLFYDGYKVDQPIYEIKNSNNNNNNNQNQSKYYGIQKDHYEAAKYMKMATDLGDLNSMRIYRMMLYDGDGVKKNRKAAAGYFKIDADRGDISSITKYATMLYMGDGVDQDFEEAARYFNLAVKKKNTYAMRMLGLMYKTGSGVDYNLQESIKYYRMAADLGDDDALKDLIKMFDGGCKMFVHTKDVANYYKMAADKGDKEALKKYKEIMWSKK